MKLSDVLNQISPIAILLSAKVGASLIPFSYLISQPKWPQGLRVLVSTLYCVGAACIICIANGLYTSTDVITSVLVTLFTFLLLDQLLLARLGLTGKWEKYTSLVLGNFGTIAVIFGGKIAEAWTQAKNLAPAVTSQDTGTNTPVTKGP